MEVEEKEEEEKEEVEEKEEEEEEEEKEEEEQVMVRTELLTRSKGGYSPLGSPVETHGSRIVTNFIPI